MNNIFLLKEGENTNFFADENGALMIKVVKIKKGDDINSLNEDYKKFYNEKFKNKNSLENIEKFLNNVSQLKTIKIFGCNFLSAYLKNFLYIKLIIF